MRPENARAASDGELARAEETLRAAEILLREGLTSDSVSRAYYAAFHRQPPPDLPTFPSALAMEYLSSVRFEPKFARGRT